MNFPTDTMISVMSTSIRRKAPGQVSHRMSHGPGPHSILRKPRDHEGPTDAKATQSGPGLLFTLLQIPTRSRPLLSLYHPNMPQSLIDS